MLEKTAMKGTDVKVTFRMPPLDGVVELYLCGEFNNWHTAGVPLSQEPDGSWVATLILQGGKSYRFRYLDNQGRWHNDWDADAYVPNDFGTEDSVVDLVASPKKVPQPERMPGARATAAGKGTSAKSDAAGRQQRTRKETPLGKKASPKKRGPRAR